LSCSRSEQDATASPKKYEIGKEIISLEITTSDTLYETIGCFQDSLNRAIPTLEGLDPILDGSYWTRHDPINKCYQDVKKRGFYIFALQDGGSCASSFRAAETFDK